jgi:hypothetical protein
MLQQGDSNFDEALLKAIKKKSTKSTDYAKNINLLVLSEYGDKEDFSKAVAIAQASIFESIYLFVLKIPVPCNYDVATLKSPADPLEYYHLGVNPVDGTGEVIPKGYFKPIS